MTTLDVLERIQRDLDALRSLEEVRAQKLNAEQLAAERALLLANALATLRKIPNVNGTIAEDIRRQRTIIETHLRSTAA